MSEKFGNFFLPKASPKGGPAVPKPALGRSSLRVNQPQRKPVFSKVFRWRLPDGQTRKPDSVEVVGTFTQWQKVPLTQNSDPDAWQVMLHEIPAHRTHHYMILVDGQPAYDGNNDGLAIPHGPEEVRYQIMTDRGPRVFMLFAQSK
jgi:hypothetical protein